MNEGRLSGKLALVTGAAGGIGRGIALKLASEGARVFATDILEREIEATARLVRDEGGMAVGLAHDVLEESAWQRVTERIKRDTGGSRLDVLVNNAGRCAIRNLEDSSLAEWRETIAINLDSVFLGIRECLPLLRESPSASIVNLSSSGGMVGVPGLGAYTAAKGGIRALSKTAAIEFAQKGYAIRVNSIHPGPVATERAVSLMSEAYGIGKDEIGEKVGRTLPLRRLGTPADIASMVAFLASDESAWITGAEFVVDGGDIAR